MPWAACRRSHIDVGLTWIFFELVTNTSGKMGKLATETDGVRPSDCRRPKLLFTNPEMVLQHQYPDCELDTHIGYGTKAALHCASACQPSLDNYACLQRNATSSDTGDRCLSSMQLIWAQCTGETVTKSDITDILWKSFSPAEAVQLPRYQLKRLHAQGGLCANTDTTPGKNQ